MSDEWDGKERRAGFSDFLVHMAEIRKDIGYIKSGMEEHRASLGKHFQEDDARFAILTDRLDGVRQIAWKVIGGMSVLLLLMQYLPQVIRFFNNKGG